MGFFFSANIIVLPGPLKILKAKLISKHSSYSHLPNKGQGRISKLSVWSCKAVFVPLLNHYFWKSKYRLSWKRGWKHLEFHWDLMSLQWLFCLCFCSLNKMIPEFWYLFTHVFSCTFTWCNRVSWETNSALMGNSQQPIIVALELWIRGNQVHHIY